MRASTVLFICAILSFSSCGGNRNTDNSNGTESVVVNKTAKRPTLMIVPSDKWCIDNRFSMDFTQMDGSSEKVADYNAAFIKDNNLPGVISNVGQQLTDLGYSLKDCQQELKSIKTKDAEDNVTKSSASGAELKESPLDILKRKTKSDVIIQIAWIQRYESGANSIEFTIEAFDAYTNKRIATSTAISEPSKEIVPRIIADELKKHIAKFDDQLVKWYADTEKNGREISLRVRVWDNSPVNFETENENGDEFIDVIQKWMKQNTVNGAFNLTDNTENVAQFEQVRIPLFDENGDGVDARAFATALRKYLKSQYDVTSKVMVRGLGEANLVIGEK